MKSRYILFLLCLCSFPLQTYSQNRTSILKNVAIQHLDLSFELYDRLQKTIWRNAELGFLEVKSSELLQQHLKENGFKIESGVAGIPTAFVATYGSGGPVIGILAEFDALPGLSQDTVSFRKPLVEGGGGHGCGHNVFGIGSMAGAIAIKHWLAQTRCQGTIKLFGTPAEEGGGGKVYMAREGVFNNVDVMLDWHPGTNNFVNVGSGTAVLMVDYTFKGIAAHAANNPEKGRSALDAVEAMDFMVNMMREHVLPSTRIHYVIQDGGEAPNVVPTSAKVSYYIRSPRRDVLRSIAEWVDQAAEGAAKGTQTQVKKEIICGFYEKLDNRALSKIVQKNLEIVGGVIYDAREQHFAEEIAKVSGQDPTNISQVKEVLPLAEETLSTWSGSTDVGDVSWNIPTTTFRTSVFVPGTSLHSWQNVAVCGTTIGTKALLNAAKVFSLTAIDLYSNPKLIQNIRNEFEKKRGKNFKYTPLLGDRAPALDYRVARK